MGRPGKRWKVELTRKNVSSIRTMDGSGAKPGIIGLMSVEGMVVLCFQGIIWGWI